MSHFAQDLRYATRTLARRPGFSLIAAGTLALGIGATTAIFSVVNSVLLRPLPYADSERIVQIWARSTLQPRQVQFGSIPWLDFLDYRDGSTSFQAMAVYRNSNITLANDDGAEIVPGAEASADFFRVFGAQPAMGRAFTNEETRQNGPNVAVIGYGFWQERLGGRSDVIGSTIQLQGTTYEIIGVAPDGFAYPGGARIWLPVRNNDAGCGRGCYLFASAGLLREGASPERARTELVAISERLSAEHPQNTNVVADVATLHEVIVGDVRLALFVVFGAVLMVLLIACANVANLMLVRGSSRGTEMAVRAVLGAGRRRLIAQLVTESATLAVIGTVFGILLATWGVDMLRDIAPGDLPRAAEIGLDGRALGFAVAMAGITIFLFGLIPALRLSASPFAQTLREGGRGSTGGTNRARGIILATEVALSITLLLGAGLLLRSLSEMRSVEPGFNPDGVAHFSFSLPRSRYPEAELAVGFVESVAAELAAQPGIDGAGFVIGLPFGRTRISGGFTRTDQPRPEPGQGPDASFRAIDPGYFATMDIPVIAGRNFQLSDRHGTLPVAIINQALAREYFAGEDPLGRQIDLQVSVGYADTLPRTIVGIVGDVRSNSLTQPDVSAMYVPEAQAGGSFGAIVMKSAMPAADVLRTARDVVASIDAQVPLVRPGTMHELLADDTARHTFYLTLIGLFAVLALTLAAVGMYGVVAYGVAQRTREIGVRMALGARAQEVVSLVVWQGLRPAILGAIAGIVLAIAAARIIAGLLYDVAPHDPISLVTVCVLLIAVVGLACALPARRATRIPPAIALRAD
jgi:putative ABC transport system permease protein